MEGASRRGPALQEKSGFLERERRAGRLGPSQGTSPQCSLVRVLTSMCAQVYVCPRVYVLTCVWAGCGQERSFVEALQNWHSEKIIDLYVAAEAATEGAAEARAGEAGQVCRLSALTQQPGRNRPGNEGVGIPLHLRLPAALSNQPQEHASKRRTVQGCLSNSKLLHNLACPGQCVALGSVLPCRPCCLAPSSCASSPVQLCCPLRLHGAR